MKLWRVLTRILRLAFLAASGGGDRGRAFWGGLGAYAFILGLQFFGVWLSLRLIAWNKAFYDALGQLDGAEALRQIGVFGLIISCSAGNFLLGDWLRKRLLMRWRENLTRVTMSRWLEGKAYWRLRPGLSPTPVDNPDQRLAEDCRLFIHHLLGESLDLISNIVALVSYVALLWSLSAFPLSFVLGGTEISIPRYMVWAAFIYVALSTLLTQGLGGPLKGLYFAQERREADFRHALVQMRENATEIAVSGGEAAERRRLDGLFSGIKENWRRLIRRELILGLFTRPYFQTVLRIPTFLALPAYFAGAVTLGGLMQLASAFSNVVTTLSWFIFSYKELAAFVAVSERLDGLLKAAETPEPLPSAPVAILRAASGGDSLRTHGLRLFTPEGRALAPTPDLNLKPASRTWLVGPSGQGKSTLLAALAGVWPYGEGRIELPEGRMDFIPQGGHVFAGGLAASACYPEDPAALEPEKLRRLLLRLGLEHRADRLEAPAAESLQGLSMGERQRLAFARAVLARPDWIILDEATSGLDLGAETALLRLLREEAPQAAILMVSHRPPVGLGPHDVIRIGGELSDPQDESRDSPQPEARMTA
ncbi:SbmA/BacA-like family transporter [Neomegalonema sp.]|uniref:ABC transporter ATP-binding protein/permease n=1 Tax=Neomegalonema sp. TaxID=2039713 RepID=UPI002618EC0F|nr:SbmA/BacA-like family transporter [Neomegalonema sp.]MDD2868362.1 SbmA/BacA-like family transporter [Neomegalonema sp.]